MLLATYSATLAPSVTWWDSGELIAAVHSLGIPHPPGTALYVVVGKVWTMLTWPLDFAIRVNLLSAVATAVAVGVMAAMLARWTRQPLAAFAAAICGGAASSVWRNANEAEVYALALLASVLILYFADRAGSAEPAAQWKWILLCAYACGLAYSLHLSALVAVPGAAMLIAPLRTRLNLRCLAQAGALVVLGVSVVLYLFVRAQHDPSINQGNPESWAAFADVLTREQYANPGLWPRQAPLYLQIGNWFEYADWQFALGLNPSPPPSWARTSITILFVVLALYGSFAHRTNHRRSWRAMATLFATASVGVVLYLNLKAGPSFGEGVLPAGTAREARERDYFFATSFLVWGLWAGFGAIIAAQAAASRARAAGARTIVLLAGIVVVAAPIALNWNAVDRRAAPDRLVARDSARVLLDGVAHGGILLAAGDNDTYPLWYAQVVAGRRVDVTVVTIPLLAATWYRQELARRHSLAGPVVANDWHGLRVTLAEVCGRARAAGRSIALAPRVPARTLPQECVSSPPPSRDN